MYMYMYVRNSMWLFAYQNVAADVESCLTIYYCGFHTVCTLLSCTYMKKNVMYACVTIIIIISVLIGRCRAEVQITGINFQLLLLNLHHKIVLYNCRFDCI